MPRSSSISVISSARRRSSAALSWGGRGSCISVFNSAGNRAATPKSSPLCRRSSASVAPPSATRGAMTNAVSGSFATRSRGVRLREAPESSAVAPRAFSVVDASASAARVAMSRSRVDRRLCDAGFARWNEPA
eukprot:30957-Pelagococcus_subviridis.AAC.47